MTRFLTIVCKLNPTPEQVVKIEATLKAFADACNYVHETVQPTMTSGRRIQTLAYTKLRSIYGLSANLAIRVCVRVGTSRQAAKEKGQLVSPFKPTSVDYDVRIFAFREKDWTVSLTLLNGREHIPLIASNYQRGKLTGRNPTSAQLCKHQDGQYFIHIEVKDDARSRRSIGQASNGAMLKVLLTKIEINDTQKDYYAITQDDVPVRVYPFLPTQGGESWLADSDGEEVQLLADPELFELLPKYCRWFAQRESER